MLYKGTHCAGCVSANTMPHQVRCRAMYKFYGFKGRGLQVTLQMIKKETPLLLYCNDP